jgi:hypothetical protein
MKNLNKNFYGILGVINNILLVTTLLLGSILYSLLFLNLSLSLK